MVANKKLNIVDKKKSTRWFEWLQQQSKSKQKIQASIPTIEPGKQQTRNGNDQT